MTTLATDDVFELQRLICRKSPILTYPRAFGASVRGVYYCVLFACLGL